MAVNSITFGGVNSADFGIYISGEGVFNAPKRDVEMITIPGRNGAFALDNGRFENIEVTYPAFNFEPNDYDTFAQRLSDFRNAICAQRGYQRLEDTFHPDEYRMAAYIGGLDIKPIKYNTASEFDITFDCKPQRWLKDGETAVTMASGDTLTNPTLFESSPLLEVGGSGSIQFNGYEIEFAGIPYGEVVIADHMGYSSSSNPYTKTVTLDTSLLNTGDSIYSETKDCEIQATLKTSGSGYFRSVGLRNAPTNVLDTSTDISSNKKEAYLYMWPDLGEGFVYGTAKTLTCSAEYRYSVTSLVAYYEKVDVTIAYDGDDSVTVTISRSGTLEANTTRLRSVLSFPTMYGDSSKPNTAPIFIDCDLGEAYTNEGGVYRSLNQYIDLGSELPTLGVGANEVTFDNTITELKITPRFWKV